MESHRKNDKHLDCVQRQFMRSNRLSLHAPRRIASQASTPCATAHSRDGSMTCQKSTSMSCTGHFNSRMKNVRKLQKDAFI
jgi:hypothetical protein